MVIPQVFKCTNKKKIMNPQKEDTRHMYADLAWTWPLISPPSDYVKETEILSKIIKEHSQIEVKTLLHLGCGGGHNDYTFKKYFDVTGVDISCDMLELAGTLNPEVTYHQGDMRTVRLRTQFDAVVILDSLGYMTSAEDLERAFATAYHHVTPGGVFLTLAEVSTDNFKQNMTDVTVCSRDNTDIVFIENYYDPDTTDTVLESTFVYLIRRSGRLEVHTDRHVLGIFDIETWVHLLQKKFTVKQVTFENSTSPDRHIPLFVCSNPVQG